MRSSYVELGAFLLSLFGGRRLSLLELAVLGDIGEGSDRDGFDEGVTTAPLGVGGANVIA